MTGSSVSSAIHKYDGIFKFVYNESVQKHFLKARTNFANGCFKEAEEELSVALGKCTDQRDTAVVTLVLAEWQRHTACQIPDDAESRLPDWHEVRGRRPERHDEGHSVLPQGVFILTFNTPTQGQVKVVGRKTLSRLWLEDKIPELFCSQVTGQMFLGLLDSFRVTESKTSVFFHPLTPEEKLGLFEEIVRTDAKDVEIVHPFPLLKEGSKEECCSPPEGWDVDASYDDSLSHGELHIRAYTAVTLTRLGMTSHRLYDTACSTGVFLHSLKQAFPSCTTIGQDLSRQMCDVARARVDLVHCGSAITPMVDPGTADVIFNRFLNSEVVTSEAAEQLLAAILPALAPGGAMITFGHTPVLLTSANFRMIDSLCMERCVGVAVDKSSIFQYYIARRK